MKKKSTSAQASVYPLADLVQDIAGISALVLFGVAVLHVGVLFN